MTDDERKKLDAALKPVSVGDVSAWMSFRLIEAMVVLESVEVASIVLRAGGIPQQQATTGDDRDISRAAWNLVDLARAEFGRRMADWMDGLTMAVALQHGEGLPEGMTAQDALDQYRQHASRSLTDRVDREVRGLQPWLGSVRSRLIGAARSAIQQPDDAEPIDLRGHLPELNPSMPTDPLGAAAQVLRALGYSTKVVEDLVEKESGFYPPGGTPEEKKS